MAHAATSVHHGHHITPKKTLIIVFLALIGLTVLTVLTSRLDLGALNVPLALAIACTKAALVVMFFMALKYDSKVNTLVFTVGSIFVMVFLVFTLFDTAFRGDLGNVGAEPISDLERREEALRARDPGAAGLRIAPADMGTGPQQAAAAVDSTAQQSPAAVDSTAQQGPAADSTAQ